MPKRILFVCTGNTCRSPMAEGLLRLMAKEAGIEADVRSAGVAAVDGGPISEHTRSILQEKGAVGLDSLRSQSVKQELVRWADVILTMTVGHKRAVAQSFPEAIDKTFTLKEYVIDDPEVLAAMRERETVSAELETKRALGQTVGEEEHNRLLELERKIPDFDIADPFGGDRGEYEKVARELEGELKKLLNRLSGQDVSPS